MDISFLAMCFSGLYFFSNLLICCSDSGMLNLFVPADAQNESILQKDFSDYCFVSQSLCVLLYGITLIDLSRK